MKVKKEVLIIIPAYNEEKTIPQLLQQLEQAKITDYADVLVMNDASADATSWVTNSKSVRRWSVMCLISDMAVACSLDTNMLYGVDISM